MLRFLVDCYVADELDKINERTIGAVVFSREMDWDPSIDTIVRSEVRRLRTKLKLYYETAGSTESVRIDIPRGSYTPRIAWKEPEAASARTSTPTAASLSESLASPVSKDGHGLPLTMRWRWFVLCSAFMPILVALAVLPWLSPGSKPSVEYRVTPLTTDLGEEFSPAVSPDGTRVAYVSRTDGTNTRILMKRVTEPNKEGQPITSLQGIYLYPAWSPNGTALTYLRVDADRVTIIQHILATGAERAIGTVAKENGKWSELPSPLLGNPGPEWMRDGHRIVIADHSATHSGLNIMDDSGHETALTTVTGEIRDYSPRLSPDGKLIAFVRYFSHGISDIYLVPAAGGAEQRVTFDQHELLGIAWDRDGKAIVVSSNRDGAIGLWRVPLLRKGFGRGIAEGRMTRLIMDSDSPTEPALSPVTGAMFFDVSHQNWNIWRLPLVPKAVTAPMLLLASSGRNYDASYSPDGKRIAFISDRGGTMQLWIANADGSAAAQRTHLEGSWMGGIAWSPNGRTIAFDARPKGHSAVYLIDADTGAPRLLDANGFEERMPSFSHDGNNLYLNSDRGGEVAIWKFDLALRVYQPVTSQAVPGVFAAAESSRGGLVYGTRSGELWETPSKGATPELLTSVHVQPNLSWTPGPDGIYFTAADSNGELQLYRNTGNGNVAVASIRGELVRNGTDLAISPDGLWALVSKQEIASGDIRMALPRVP